MRKAERLFEIIQILRLARGPVTAAAIAERLEVAPRSVYRDIGALQGMRVPIEGGRGIGYILRPGFTLPPLMFTVEETEAVVLALALLKRSGDGDLKKAAARVSEKLGAVVPTPLRLAMETKALHAWGPPPPTGIELSLVRRAIRDEEKLFLAYRDEAGNETCRTVWPIALIYYPSSTNIVGWCELRGAIRHFRAERVREGRGTAERFGGHGERLRAEWAAGWTKPAV
ncbi:transcriptional regulator [Aureimonas sp. SA4125]|uniref:helix-turn-helix transcriptional regulator n=1 Tax=Aureimonas sp. SA4125 TaxID=2826993 RepID=UPI001CC7C278|nr:YafY family protein [Aureimonas sp. SA4125]BDA83730.1 transcriptional regulator [Aureimonas sp. SA4125]